LRRLRFLDERKQVVGVNAEETIETRWDRLQVSVIEKILLDRIFEALLVNCHRSHRLECSASSRTCATEQSAHCLSSTPGSDSRRESTISTSPVTAAVMSAWRCSIRRSTCRSSRDTI